MSGAERSFTAIPRHLQQLLKVRHLAVGGRGEHGSRLFEGTYDLNAAPTQAEAGPIERPLHFSSCTSPSKSSLVPVWRAARRAERGLRDTDRDRQRVARRARCCGCSRSSSAVCDRPAFVCPARLQDAGISSCRLVRLKVREAPHPVRHAAASNRRGNTDVAVYTVMRYNFAR